MGAKRMARERVERETRLSVLGGSKQRERVERETRLSVLGGSKKRSLLHVHVLCLLLLLLYYQRISQIRGPATYAGGASPAALTHSRVLFPYRQEHTQLSSNEGGLGGGDRTLVWKLEAVNPQGQLALGGDALVTAAARVAG